MRKCFDMLILLNQAMKSSSKKSMLLS